MIPTTANAPALSPTTKRGFSFRESTADPSWVDVYLDTGGYRGEHIATITRDQRARMIEALQRFDAESEAAS